MAELKATCEALATPLHVIVDQLETCSIEKVISYERNLEEIIRSVWDAAESHPFVTLDLKVSEKSEEEANKLRVDGNRFYKEGDYGKALQLYNSSIVVAPHPFIKEMTELQSDSTADDDIFMFPYIDPSKYGGITEGESVALAKGFANRSAIMLRLRCYEKCVNDIDLAFQYGFPKELRFKLEERKQYCIDSLNKVGKDGNDPSESKRSDHTQSEELYVLNSFLVADCNKYPSLQALVSHKLKKHPELTESHQNIPSLSSSVDVCCTPARGRGVVALRNICPGEVICVERAYCMSIDLDYLATFCSTCLSFCLTPLPCPGCCMVIFCSKSCQIKGLSEEHWIECSILPQLSLKMSHKAFSYKLLKTLSHHQMAVIQNQLENEKQDRPEKMGRDRKGIYNSSSYQAVHHLCMNKNKTSLHLVVKLATLAVKLTKLIEQSGRYFVNSCGEQVTPTREDIAGTAVLLLSHLLRMNCNQFSLLDNQVNEERDLGVGIFPAASLFNHSCNASVGQSMHGRVLVLRALRPIQAGEEVTYAYISGFSNRPLVERRKSLFPYQFHCCCEACTNNWPVYELLPKFRCIECRVGVCDKVGICVDCSLKYWNSEKKRKSSKRERKRKTVITKQIQMALEKAEVVHHKLKSNSPISQEDTNVVCQSVQVVQQYMALPCQGISYLENVLLGCFQEEI